jgi:hypothetical protein
VAEIKEVSVSKSCRVNTGNYEGTEYFINLKAELDDFDGIEDVTQELNEALNLALLDQLRRGYAAKGKKVSLEDIAKRHAIPYEKC